LGVVISIDPGFVCHIAESDLLQYIWSFPALCFLFWAFSVPVGLIIASIGLLIAAGAKKRKVWKFGLGVLGIFLLISFANGPIPHVPLLFGIGGTFVLLVYFSILWKHAHKLKDNVCKLAGYTFLVIGFWFTCGLGSRQYQPILGDGESPIDIMIYFVLAMLFFWLSEKKESNLNK
jgi:hypothetical protein